MATLRPDLLRMDAVKVDVASSSAADFVPYVCCTLIENVHHLVLTLPSEPHEISFMS